MKIEKFTNDDFAKAAPLAAGAWGDFYADERQWFIDAVAEYILRYNYSNPSLALKDSEQFTKLLPTIGMLAGYLLSFYCLSHALRTLPIGIAYAIWSKEDE